MLKKNVFYLSTLFVATIGSSGKFTAIKKNNEKHKSALPYKLRHKEISKKVLKIEGQTFKNQKKSKMNSRVQSFEYCIFDNVDFKDMNLHGISFKGSKFIRQDFSHQNLQNVDFSECIFGDVDFTNTDLNGVVFDGAKFFKNVNLAGAILYYPLDDKGQPMIEKAFRVKGKFNDALLAEQHTYLIQQIKIEQNKENQQEVDILYKKLECINKLISILQFDFSCKEFSGFCLENNYSNLGLTNTDEIVDEIMIDDSCPLPSELKDKQLREIYDLDEDIERLFRNKIRLNQTKIDEMFNEITIDEFWPLPSEFSYE